MPFYFRAEIKVYSKLLIVLEGGQIGGQIQLTELQIFTQHLSTWFLQKLQNQASLTTFSL